MKRFHEARDSGRGVSILDFDRDIRTEESKLDEALEQLAGGLLTPVGSGGKVDKVIRKIWETAEQEGR